MAAKLMMVLRAAVQEFRQLYALSCLLEDLKRDVRRLDDVGLSFAHLKTYLEMDQRSRSPLRQVLLGNGFDTGLECQTRTRDQLVLCRSVSYKVRGEPSQSGLSDCYTYAEEAKALVATDTRASYDDLAKRHRYGAPLPKESKDEPSDVQVRDLCQRPEGLPTLL
jgi:hypothetical protein